jgi:cell wall-associated NlpC family hydrolase
MKFGALTTYALGIAVFLIAFAIVGYLIGDGSAKKDAIKTPPGATTPPIDTQLLPGTETPPTNDSGASDDGVQSEKVPKGMILLDDVSPISEDGHRIDDMQIGDEGLPSEMTAQALQKVYPKNTNVTAMLDFAKSLLGTPYEYGSSRSDPSTFDCSDFVQYVFKQSFGMQLPRDSRGQKEYVKQFGSHRYADWRRLSPGDLIFFSAYRGSAKANYADVQRDVTRVTHVGIYMGKTPEGKHLMINTASRPHGVKIDVINGRHWEYRVVYGGRAY